MKETLVSLRYIYAQFNLALPIMSDSIPHYKGLCVAFGRLALIEDTSSIDPNCFHEASEAEVSELLVRLNNALSDESLQTWPLPFVNRNRLACDANGWFDVA